MRVFNGCFIVLFMTMLVLPFVFVDLSSDRVSVEENRMLAERPHISDIKSRPGTFVRDFNAWFKDSTGFRKQLISLFQMIDKNKWLNAVVRYTDGQYTYLVGEEGHHYFTYVGGFLIPKFMGKQFLSNEQLAKMADKLETVKTYLDGKGIPLVVMFCTDKESVYPEYYPKSIKRGQEPIQLDIITSYLKEHTSVDVFNIRQALLAEKNNYPLYYKIDTKAFTSDFAHYNHIGAFFAYRELMKHVNTYLPEIIPYELNDIDISYDEKERPVVSLKTEKTYKNMDTSFFDDVEFKGNAFENIEHDLPVILFLNDSYAFVQFIGKYFAQQFGKAIFIHYANLGYFEEIITYCKPDIVVFESAERELRGFAYCVNGIPELP